MADPIDVKAPDGSIVRFPAGTTDEVINGAMSKEFGGAKAAAAAEPDRSAYSTGVTEPTVTGDEAAAQIRQWPSAVDSAVRSLANGIPFMDRIAAAGGAATGIGGKFGDYSGNLEAQRGEDKKLADAAPGVDTRLGKISLDSLGHIVGGTAAAIATGGGSVLGGLASDVPLGLKTVYGALTGGAIGGVQGLSSTKDLTDLPQAAKDTAIGAAGGALVGGVIPGAAKVIGAGYNAVTNALTGRVEGMSRAASGHLVNAVAADGPAAVQARLAELGPDAMLADAGPALLGKMQGAVLNSDEGRSIGTNALTNRNVGTNARVQGDVNRALGPAEDPQTVTDAIKAHRTAVDSVNYPAALDNAPSVKIAPIMTDLIDRIDQTPVGSMEHKALTNLQSMLTKTEKQPLLDAQGIQQYDHLGNERWKDVQSSHDDANVLHKVKGELDNVIEYDAPGLGVPAGALTRQQGSLKQMRGAINDALETQVPGYGAANDVSAALAKRGEAVNLGTQYLGAGKTTASPDRFAAAFEPLQQGEKIAFAKGSRGNIDRVLGTKANDLQALRGELQGEGGWNTDKIATVHGQSAADELTNTVDRNLKFRDTYNKVVENSQTAQRNAAAKEMKPDPSTDTPLFNPNSTLSGMGVTVAKKGIQGVVNALTRSDPTRSYGEVARALSEQGTARDARLAAVIQALGSRQSNAAAAPAVGNTSAVVAAILGNTALRDGPMRRRQQ
jgi:hypothetical protein